MLQKCRGLRKRERNGRDVNTLRFKIKVVVSVRGKRYRVLRAACHEDNACTVPMDHVAIRVHKCFIYACTHSHRWFEGIDSAQSMNHNGAHVHIHEHSPW